MNTRNLILAAVVAAAGFVFWRMSSSNTATERAQPDVSVEKEAAPADRPAQAPAQDQPRQADAAAVAAPETVAPAQAAAPAEPQDCVAGGKKLHMNVSSLLKHSVAFRQANPGLDAANVDCNSLDLSRVMLPAGLKLMYRLDRHCKGVREKFVEENEARRSRRTGTANPPASPAAARSARRQRKLENKAAGEEGPVRPGENRDAPLFTAGDLKNNRTMSALAEELDKDQCTLELYFDEVAGSDAGEPLRPARSDEAVRRAADEMILKVAAKGKKPLIAMVGGRKSLAGIDQALLERKGTRYANVNGKYMVVADGGTKEIDVTRRAYVIREARGMSAAAVNNAIVRAVNSGVKVIQVNEVNGDPSMFRSAVDYARGKGAVVIFQ